MKDEKISKGLEKQVKNLKRLGLYSAVVLIVFALMIPIIGRKLNTMKETGFTEQVVDLPESQVESEPEKQESMKKTDSDIIVAESSDPIKETTEAALKIPDIKRIIWPLKGEIIQEVGIVYSRTFSDYRYHNGIDIKAASGAEVAAILPGRVDGKETSRSEVKKIIIDHGSGWQSVYSHLENVFFEVGDNVKAGQAIGRIGQPGLNEIIDGPHLHFTLLKDGKVLNPLVYLPQ